MAAVLEDVVTPADRRAAYLEAGLWDGTTMVGNVEHHAQSRPDALAVVDDHGRRATYAELWRDATTLAAHLVAHGVRPGNVISVQLPNRYEAAVAAVAVQRAGAVLNPLLPGYRRKELRHVFETAGTRAIVTMAEYRGFAYGPMIDELRADTGLDVHHVVVGGSAAGAASLHEVLNAPPETAGLPEHPRAEAVSELIFTSGTEAAPKAIMHTEQTANFSVRVAYADLNMTPDDVVWMPSPVGHSTGFNYGLRMALYNGVPLVLQDQWNAGTACDLVLAERCSYTMAATTFLKDLVEEAARRGVKLASLQRFGCGGAPVPPDLVEAALQQGIQVLRLYGSTEVLVGTWNRPGAPLDKRKHTDGSPMSHVEVELRDDEGRPVQRGAQGEIFTRGPNTCVGFFRDPERTARIFDDGWVRSGDVAVMDEAGCITIVGRKKEIIIRGGMNITPREIEDMLQQFPEVHRAAVVGLPDDRLGERCCACVVLRDGATLEFAGMVQRLRAAGMADYKLPERLEILSELPTTASGKIQKHEIVRGLMERDPAGRWDRA
ncbi:MAG TPA: AMP-binding protein [Candidatus Dormibacteraeota bacterium]|nr:AMP-binding protein [Candidatus Dormibacteraeota bacterium]